MRTNVYLYSGQANYIYVGTVLKLASNFVLYNLPVARILDKIDE